MAIRNLQREIVERGHDYACCVHLQCAERASAQLASCMGVKPGARVFHTLLVHFEDGLALQCEDRYVNPSCAPEYLSVDFASITPTRYLLGVAPVWEAQCQIEASCPTTLEARLLDISKANPCLAVVRRTLNRGVPTSIGRLVHPGSRYLLRGDVAA